MTAAAPDNGPAESADAREARRAIDDHLGRTAAHEELARWRDGGRIDDRTAEDVARAAWDAVQDATPPPPSPTDATPPPPQAGPAEKTARSPERAERHRRAVAVALGLRELGYHLDETLLPGPDMAAG
ncbi:hypothetical protein ACIPPS_12070 [Streptomyces sp. NPDC090127]|uniref:hypothetical protein n=1 Tax=Streptomyces sp. NPDC090127 TaxID=3365953 RepID=UPI003811B59F